MSKCIRCQIAETIKECLVNESTPAKPAERLCLHCFYWLLDSGRLKRLEVLASIQLSKLEALIDEKGKQL